MDKKRVRITLKGPDKPSIYRKAFRAYLGDELKSSDESIRRQINNLSYEDMKLASRLSANLINGVRVVPDTDSPAVNALLRTLKERDRNSVIRTTQYINRAIVRKNETDNKPSVDAVKIYKEMMDF